jgi:5-formyltetrahydrofolate cyclo-ligase
MTTSKDELRASLKQARAALAAEERQAKSVAIADRLKQAIDWSEIATLYCYKPIASLNEVDISGFISALRAEYPNIEIYTPKQVNNVWQIPDLKLDVIIVPTLGFDPKTLHRIGYGGGYYDRFLAFQPQAKKIGVCFEQGKIDYMPAESHDILLNMIISEIGRYECS